MKTGIDTDPFQSKVIKYIYKSKFSIRPPAFVPMPGFARKTIQKFQFVTYFDGFIPYRGIKTIKYLLSYISEKDERRILI